MGNSESYKGRALTQESDVLLRGAARLRRSWTQLQQTHPVLSASISKLAIGSDSISCAAERIAPFSKRTPVMTCSTIERQVFNDVESPTDCRILFKCENFQKVGAFKFRGAMNAVSHALEEITSKESNSKGIVTIVTESSGNHGQGIALAAKMRGCPAVVVMPKDAPRAKIDAVQGYGGTVVLVDPEEREVRSKQVLHEKNGILIHPSNDPDVMSGQGTVALEWFEQATQLGLHRIDVIIVPVGGGGLLSGVTVAAKILNPKVIVIAAEPANADDAYRSWKSGERQGHKDGVVPDTIAGGLRSTLGSNTWPVVRDLVDQVVCVSEDEIAQAMHLYFERMKLVVEPSGAVALAAALQTDFVKRTRHKFGSFKTVGILITGGNVSVEEPFPFQHPTPSTA